MQTNPAVEQSKIIRWSEELVKSVR